MKTYISPEEKARKAALRRIRKKVCGDFGVPKCAVCGHVYTDDEILSEDFIWSVGHGLSVQICEGCLKVYLGG